VRTPKSGNLILLPSVEIGVGIAKDDEDLDYSEELDEGDGGGSKLELDGPEAWWIGVSSDPG
jgi:hypothetical protein